MRVVRSSTFHTNLTGKNLKVLNILCYDDDDDDDDDDEDDDDDDHIKPDKSNFAIVFLKILKRANSSI